MRKILLICVLSTVSVCPALADVGDTFTVLTAEGVEMTFVVTDEENKTCQAGTGNGIESRCVSSATKGSVTIPRTAGDYRVTAVAEFAFYMCYGVSSVILPEGITSIGQEAFNESGVEELSIPASVTTIGITPFPHLTRLTVSVDNPVFSSPEGSNAVIETATQTLVAGCGGTVIPPGVTSIRSYAFSFCPVSTIEIPQSVTSIGGHAFYFSGLLTIEIPSSITVLEDGVFDTCGALSSVTLPEGLETIGPKCFRNCNKMTSINLPESLRTLGHNVFESCESLEEVVIPEGVEEVPDYAFIQCSSLRDVRLPESIRRIGDGVFAACLSLDSVSLPSGLSELGYSVFGDGSLSSIRLFCATPPSANETTFMENYQIRLYVPQGSAETYRSAEVWRNFKDIVEFDTNHIADIKPPVTQEPAYDLTGRRLSSIPSHGVYIRGGRTYVK